MHIVRDNAYSKDNNNIYKYSVNSWKNIINSKDIEQPDLYIIFSLTFKHYIKNQKLEEKTGA